MPTMTKIMHTSSSSILIIGGCPRGADRAVAGSPSPLAWALLLVAAAPIAKLVKGNETSLRRDSSNRVKLSA